MTHEAIVECARSDGAAAVAFALLINSSATEGHLNCEEGARLCDAAGMARIPLHLHELYYTNYGEAARELYAAFRSVQHLLTPGGDGLAG